MLKDMKKRITYNALFNEIVKDYNIEPLHKIKTFKKEFPVKNGKRKIKSSHDAVIVDNEGIEYPYMLTQHQRNYEKLKDFDYIYVLRRKPLHQILQEANITLKSEPCKICEGGGWYSKGKRVFYKEFFCEY
jgi:hypothetical protein